VQGGAGVATVTVAGSSTPLRCQDPAGRATLGAEVGVMVRPEWFALSDADTLAEPFDGLTLEGEVRSGAFLGAFVRAALTVPGIVEPLVVETDVELHGRLAGRDRWRLWVPSDRAVVVDAG
jgi:hypothetical protein